MATKKKYHYKRKRVDYISLEQVPEGIPSGKLVLWGGQPGANKSTLMALIAAKQSQTAPVILIMPEDEFADTTGPRLETYSANMDNIIWPDRPEWVGPEVPHFPENVDDVEAMVRDTGAKLLIIDPVRATYGRGINETNLYDAFLPLRSIAGRYGCSIFLVKHTIKSITKNQPAQYAIGGGHAGLGALCRAIYLVGINKADRDQRLVVNAKGNTSDAPPCDVYEVDSVDLTAKPGQIALDDIVKLVYVGKADLTAEDVLFQKVPGQSDNRAQKKSEATDALISYMQDGKKHARRDVIAHLTGLGFTEVTVKRAAKAIDMETGRSKSYQGGSWWQLPLELVLAIQPGGDLTILPGGGDDD